MKKFLLAGMVFCGLLLTQSGYSQDVGTGAAAANQAVQETDHHWSMDGQSWNKGQYSVPGACDEPRDDHACADQPTGECWCLYAHYEPCYYYTKRCITENKYSQKRCCRQVPKYYEVQKCKYVPQYYTETACKYEPEYYYETECTPCKRWVSDRHVKYVPRYYYKHVCPQANTCATPAPQQQGCCN